MELFKLSPSFRGSLAASEVSTSPAMMERNITRSPPSVRDLAQPQKELHRKPTNGETLLLPLKIRQNKCAGGP